MIIRTRALRVFSFVFSDGPVSLLETGLFVFLKGIEMLAVRAKFKVVSVTAHEGGVSSVKLQPVTNGSDENKEFFKYTPYGSIEMGTINTSAASRFVPGGEVYVDFTTIKKE
ncbi:MAG: hypothetical protein WA071_17250 [Undibacterium umbellatum]|uniref:hypothetical protein n=1 Tax=Undibacterium umbellatum TaxID=2762300 RepID=UPI003BB5BDCB